MAESILVRKGPCNDCGSSDACASYDDGHTHCFSCGVTHRGGASGGDGFGMVAGQVRHSAEFLEGEARALEARNLTQETCEKWGYLVGKSRDGKPCQIAGYRDGNGALVAQKLRFKDKKFTIVGRLPPGLYGQWLWRDGGKMVVITEGEIDALSVSQLQGNKWPVVSLPNGAQGGTKAVAEALEWLAKFDKVVLLLDTDEPGRKAALACARILPPGKAYIGTLPLKDANEMLVAGRGAELIDAIWGAKQFRPDGIVSLEDIRQDVMQDPDLGLPWCFESLTNATYGRRYGEVYAVGAGTGVGKTDFLTQQIDMDIGELAQSVGVFFLEQQPAETVKRVAGKRAGRCFHVPDDGWTHEELVAAYDSLQNTGRLFLNDHFGMSSWDDIRDSIRYLRHAEGVRIFYLDHLTALASGSGEERVELERIMAEIGKLVKELDCMLILVSHLSTPEGKPHEEGGRVMIRHFKGSRAIGFWCHYMFGMERNQQADDPGEATITTFRILKDRYTGRSTGKTFHLSYDRDTGRLYETDPDNGFPPDNDGGF